MAKKIGIIVLLCFSLCVGGVSAFANEGHAEADTQALIETQPPVSSVLFRQDGADIQQSTDEGKTWQSYSPIEETDYFTYDEFSAWIENETENIQKLVDAGEWTEAEATEALEYYDEILKSILEGKMVGKRASSSDDQLFFSMPDNAQPEQYQTFVFDGNTYKSTWWPRGPEELNSPAFKAELQQIVGKLREDVLKSRFAMERFCYDHGGKIDGGYVQNYGYIVETERYRYCLRCNPSPGDYNGYLTAYDLAVQRQNMARDKPLVGRVTYANGDTQEFTDAEAFLKCVREELPYRPTTGFRYEVLTDDPSVRKQVDDIVFDLYGEENPRQLEEYQKTPKQGMTMGGIK